MPNSIDDLNDLLSPTMLGKIAIANRVVMAPMTRSRADSNDCPTQLHIDYYSQRASAGLVKLVKDIVERQVFITPTK